MKKVIVTGANGFIGSSLIKRLVEENVYVLAIDLSFKASRLPESNLIKKVEMSLNDESLMLTNIPTDRYDAFYHFAWRGVNGADKANPVIQLENAQMAIRCVGVAQKVGCEKFLCAGTIAEKATNSLGVLNKTSGGMMYGVAKHCTHLMLETYCKNIGMQFVWMQFSNIYGPCNKTGNLVSYTLEQLTMGQEATFGPALQPYDFIFVDDLLEAIYRIGENKNKQNSYYIGSGEPRQLMDYLLEIGRVYGREDLIKIGARLDDGIVYTMDMFDISELVDDIGNYVSKSFSEGIRYTIEKY
ncbi:MAG: NAD(P)-dependent oxidoreductase [Lachnospiraceae bacterium]|nr:NAD(P)-dependent oxidoreductase [Lachnospiraceae bacterium]